ncbi:hypothetical protein HOY80DRAFT_774115 [Tuber brumale]|nr:hypothetical protein HOY80DRAFT_774115 [Tuber brumale]
MEVARHSVAARYQEPGCDDRDRATDAFRSKEAKAHITTNASGRDLYTATITMMVKSDLPLDKHFRPCALHLFTGWGQLEYLDTTRYRPALPITNKACTTQTLYRISSVSVRERFRPMAPMQVLSRYRELGSKIPMDHSDRIGKVRKRVLESEGARAIS